MCCARGAPAARVNPERARQVGVGVRVALLAEEAVDHPTVRVRCITDSCFDVFRVVYIIQLTPHKLSAERNGAGAEAPAGQKTRGCIEGEDFIYIYIYF